MKGLLIFIERFQSRYTYGRQKGKNGWYFGTLYPYAEPLAVKNKTKKQWVATDINDCVRDNNNRECNFKNGDIHDHSIVRYLFLCITFSILFVPLKFYVCTIAMDGED